LSGVGGGGETGNYSKVEEGGSWGKNLAKEESSYGKPRNGRGESPQIPIGRVEWENKEKGP